MSNSVAVQTLEVTPDDNFAALAQKPVLKVVPPQTTEPPTLEALAKMYKAQSRECWLCEGIATKIESGKDLSEDDKWHFTSCVLSWEYLHPQN